MRSRRRSYKFTEKTQSKRGVIAFAISSILLVLYLVCVYLAYRGAGNLSMYYGSIGVMAMILSVVALVISITSFGEEDSFQLFPRMSLITSLLSTLCWVGTYIQGFLRG